MATNVPDALYGIYKLIDPYFKTNKIGGVANPGSPGYHTSREDLLKQGRSGDYSIQCPADKRGNAKNAAGIDITFGDVKELITLHQRLRAACTPNVSGEYDPRIECVREIIGTLDGKYVSGYNRVATGTGGRSRVGWVTSGYSDSSHLWHEHVSVLRDRVDNVNEMAGLAEVMAGVTPGTFGWKSGDEPEPATPVEPTPVPPKTQDYKVVKGDTLSAIAKRFGLTGWQAIAALNEGINPQNIKVGQTIKLPAGAVESKPAEPKPEPKPEPAPVSHTFTATYANILRRTDTLAGRRRWPDRKANVVKHINSTKPDLVLCVEVDSTTAKDIYEGLDGSWSYDRYEGVCVFWKQTEFERVGDPAYHEYSDRNNRRLQSIPLKHKASGEQVWADVTHFENDGDTGSDGHKSRKVEATEMAARTKSGKRVFGADFNSTTRGGANKTTREKEKPRPLLAGVGWKFLTDATGVTGRTYASHHGGKSSTPKGAWIDDLGYRGLDLVSGALVRTDGTDASDHHFLTATFKI